MRVPLFHVDAFTCRAFSGNPAAVCLLDGWLDDESLRKVAAENNLSETAFLVSRSDGYDLRWFTPLREVKLCGHATLASAFVVLCLLRPELDTVRFETRLSGALTVRKDGEMFCMDFPAMHAKVCADPPNLLISALGSGPQPTAVLEVNDTYILIYNRESSIQEMQPDFARLEQLHPFAVAVTAPGDKVDFVSRYFKPSYGMPEDPVTGSVHCALGTVLVRAPRKVAIARSAVIATGRRDVVRSGGQQSYSQGQCSAHLAGNAVPVTCDRKVFEQLQGQATPHLFSNWNLPAAGIMIVCAL